MCNTKPNCQTRLKAEQYEQQIAELQQQVYEYREKQIQVKNELIYYKVNGADPIATLENLIELLKPKALLIKTN